MKQIYSPNLTGDDVQVILRHPRRFARGGLARAADSVRKAGRYGDDMLVHMNKDEFNILKQAWGEPTYHPHTGMPEYFSWGDVATGIGDYMSGNWGDLLKTGVGAVTGALDKKAAYNMANQFPAPPQDPNLSTHLGTNAKNARTAIPQSVVPPQSYYTRGQYPEQQLFKNNSMAALTSTPGTQVQPAKYDVPSNGSLIAGALGSSALNYGVTHAKDIYDAIKGGRQVDANVNGPNGGSNGITWEPDVAAAAAPAAASALPALGAAPALHGAISISGMPEMASAEEIASMGGAGGAGAAGAAGELTGFAPGEITSGALSSTGGGAAAGSGTAATSGLGITPEMAGGLGAGAVAAIPAYLGLTTAPYRLDASWWNKLNTGLTQGKSGNATYDANTPADQQIYNSKQALYRMLQSQGGDTSVIGGSKGNSIPQAFRDMAMKYGMLNADGSVNQHWSAGEDPKVAAQRQASGYVMYNGHWVPGRGVNGSGSGRAFARGGVQSFDVGGLAQANYAPMGHSMMGAPQMGVPQMGGFGPRPGLPPSGQGQPMPPPGGGAPPSWQANAPMAPHPGGLGGNPFGQQQLQPPPQAMPPQGLPPISPRAAPVPSPLSAPPVPNPHQQANPALFMGQRARPWGGGALARAVGGPVHGPGTGTSDDIPARLSNGEYVIPAHVVAALGDGSTMAGAKRLDELQRQVRLLVGRQMASNRHPKPSPPPLALMGGN